MDNNYGEYENSTYTETSGNANYTGEPTNIENEMIKAYIGKGADEMLKSKLNVHSVVSAIVGQSIGPVWFFYRKSYLLGFGFIILTYIVGIIANLLKIGQAYYIMMFIYLFTTTPVYLWDVKRKVSNLILNNPNASMEELIELAKAKGGRSILAAVLYTIAIVGLIVFIIVYYAIVIMSAAKLMID